MFVSIALSNISIHKSAFRSLRLSNPAKLLIFITNQNLCRSFLGRVYVHCYSEDLYLLLINCISDGIPNNEGCENDIIYLAKNHTDWIVRYAAINAFAKHVGEQNTLFVKIVNREIKRNRFRPTRVGMLTNILNNQNLDNSL